MNVIAAGVIGVSIVLGALVFAFVGDLLRDSQGDPQAGKIDRLSEQVNRLRDDIKGLRTDLADTRTRLNDLEGRVTRLENAPPPQPAPVAQPLPDPGPVPAADLDQFGGAAPAEETENLTEPMQLAKKRFNEGIIRPTPAALRDVLGEPRSVYGETCQPVTNPRLLNNLASRNIGNVRLTMIKPALDSLEQVMARLKKEEPDIYQAIGTAGALCARYVRGSKKNVSSHAWGAAVDLTLKKNLDRMGDDSTQFGLVVLAEFFNEAGWYWGAGYSREDSMHFEVGEALLRKWKAEGKL